MGKKPGRRKSITLVGGTIVFLALALGGYYYLRTTGNEERLSRRNQRELDRIARTVELRVNNFESILTSLAKAGDPESLRETIQRTQGSLICADIDEENDCADQFDSTKTKAAEDHPVWFAIGTSEFRFYNFGPGYSDETSGQTRVAINWQLSRLEGIVQSEFFDQLMLAHEKDQVFLSTSGRTGLRLHELPRPNRAKGEEKDPPSGLQQRLSTVQTVTVAGEEYFLFLQPVNIDLQEWEGDQPVAWPEAGHEAGDERQHKAGLANPDWVLGGLVSKGRFRTEALAFAPPHLLFLSLVLVFALLALPFVRVRLMGERERLEVSDVLLLGLSFGLACGVAGVCLADLARFQKVEESFDTQLERVAGQLRGNFEDEIERAVKELDRQSLVFRGLLNEKKPAEDDPAPLLQPDPPDHEPWMRTEIFDPEEEAETDRIYSGYTMIFWTDPSGEQVAKWTPTTQNTPRISVELRDYFSAIRDRKGWSVSSVAAGRVSTGVPRIEGQYYLESIQSLTTGQHQAAISRPFRWRIPPADDEGKGEQDTVSDAGKIGVAAMIIPPISVSRPVLPPGFDFAVIDEDGRTLFHSRPERNLRENFFEEAGGSRLLQSIVAARSSHHVNATYMGRSSRLFVQPVSDTPLALVVVMEKAPLGTVNFEALFGAAVILAVYAFVLLAVFAAGEAVLRRRLAWAWPDPVWPRKRWLQMAVFLVFIVSLGLQATLWEPHLSFLIVPFQAVGFGLVAWIRVEPAQRRRRYTTGFWRGAEALGWIIVGAATIALLGAHISVPGAGGLLIPQLFTTVVAAIAVVVLSKTIRASRPKHRSENLQFYYGASLVLLMIVIGALPGYQIFRWSFQEHIGLLVRHHQRVVSGSLEDWYTTQGKGPVRGPDADLALAFQPFLSTCFAARGAASWDCADGGGRDCQCGRPGDRSWQISGESKWHEVFHEFVCDRAPFVTDIAVEMRQLSSLTIEDRERWTTSRRWPGALRFNGSQFDSPTFDIVSCVPSGVRLSPVWWTCTAVAILVFFGLGVWIGRRIFLVNLAYANPIGFEDHVPALEGTAGEASKGPNILFVCTRSTDRTTLLEDPRVQSVNMMSASTEGGIQKPRSGADKIVCIDFFDHRFDDPSWNERLLEFVERLVYIDGRRIFVLTSREPEDLLGWSGELETENCGSQECRDRWARLFGRFVTIHIADTSIGKPALPPSCPERHRRRLEDEAAFLDPLRRVVEEVVRRHDLEDLSEDALIDQVREAADGHYRAIWTILRPEERMVVAQIAAGAVVNPKSERAIRHLLARRLLIRDPELRLINESFGRFVRETAPAVEVRAWEREGAASAWQQLRIPIFLVLGAAILFLLATQQELVSTATAFISTLALASGALLRLLTLLQRAPAAPEKPG